MSQDPITSEIWVPAIGKVFEVVKMGDFNAGRRCRTVPDFVAMDKQGADREHEGDESRVNSKAGK